MKKILLLLAAIMMTAMSMGLSSCAEKEEGEDDADWVLRNTINGPAWHVDQIKNSDGPWSTWSDASLFYFWVKFSASNHNFNSEKFYYVDGEADETTREVYNSSTDNTAYTIRNAKIIEGTVNGEPYFRISLTQKVTSVMECTLYFYKENKTYEVRMTR